MRVPSRSWVLRPGVAALLALGLLLALSQLPASGASAAPAAAPIVPPKLIKYVAAEYPKALFEKGLRGAVVVELHIGVDGTVLKAKVFESAGPDFDAAALKAATQLQFSPATRAGKAMAVAIRFRYSFKPELRVDRRGRARSMSRYERRGPVRSPPGFSSLTGILLERGTGRPVPGALVLLPKLNMETLSEADGTFRFGLLPPGRHGLYMPGTDHKALRRKVTIKANQTTTLKLRPERRSYLIYRATAVAPPQPGEMARRSLSAEEIQKIPGVYGDAYKVVQNLPGVARVGGGLLVVRGSAPQDTQMFMEGVRVPLFYHFGGLYSIINTDLLEGVDFMPGGYPLRYGRGNGGVLVSRLALPKADARWSGYVESNVFHTGVLLKGPLTDDTHLAIAGRRSYVDLILDAVVPEGVLPFSQAPRYYDWQVKLDHRFDSRTNATLFFFGSNDSVAALVDQPPAAFPDAHGDLETASNFYTLMGLLRHQGKGWKTQTTLGTLFASANLGLGEAFRFDVSGTEVTVRQDVTVGEGPVQLRGGLDFYWTPFEVEALLPQFSATGERGTGTGNPPVDAERIFLSMSGSQLMPGLWLDTVFKLRDDLEVVPGFRVDLFRDLGNGETISPRINARYDWSKALTLKGALGTTSQQAQPPQLMAPPVGNPALVAQRSMELAGGLEYRFTDYLDVDLQGFYKRQWDLIVTHQLTDTLGPLAPVPYNNDGTGAIVGMELLVRHKLANNFFGWIAYTLQQAERVDHPGYPSRPFGWDQTHILTALGSYKLPYNMEVGLRWRLTSGNPYTPLSTVIWNESTDSYTRVRSTEINSKRVPPFHQLDLRFDKKWVFDSWMLNAYLDVQNVYNHMSPTGIRYNFDASQQEYFTGLPIIPSFGLKAEF